MSNMFQLPVPIVPQDHQSIFDELCDVEKVRPVNHGEFETAVNAVLNAVNSQDKGANERIESLAIQRCRRGGKTFMLSAVAAALSSSSKVPQGTHIVSITLNDTSPWRESEDALEAILTRVAYALTGSPDFIFFLYEHSGEKWTQVYKFIVESNIILIIDELNKIPHTAKIYGDMSAALSNIHGKRGSAVFYSTHKRDTADLLWGRERATKNGLSIRPHTWLSMPRIENENCIRGIKKEGSEQLSFWCAVLRGRIPSLLLLNQRSIERFAEEDAVFAPYVAKFGSTPQDYAHYQRSQRDSRTAALKAVISGDISLLPRERNSFAAYSYMADGERRLYAWPPFMVAQENVLGKDCSSLCTLLEKPQIDEAKAFEALAELSVLTRLLTADQHNLVPRNPVIPAGQDFEATEYYLVEQTSDCIVTLVNSVAREFSQEHRQHVLQVVAVPANKDFPKYDFFLLHRQVGRWQIAAGYQCKQTVESPTETAEDKSTVGVSVWIEGKCRSKRAVSDGTGKRRLVDRAESRGWVLLSAEAQDRFLGVTVAQALPSKVVDPDVAQYSTSCAAEVSYYESCGVQPRLN